MKKFTSATFFLLLFLFNCHDTRESSPSDRDLLFNRSVGKKISLQTAERWRNRYEQSEHASKTKSAPRVTGAKMREILDPLTEFIGVSYHRAIDETGVYRILVVPIKEGQPTWEADHILDANSGNLIDAQTALNWTQRYATENSSGVWSHFFGTNAFEEPFSTMDLVDAEDDQEARQLLLFIWRESVTSGRSQGETLEVYDASFPCPPTCSTL